MKKLVIVLLGLTLVTVPATVFSREYWAQGRYGYWWPHYSQQTSYYCAPAVAQMWIRGLTGRYISQSRLAPWSARWRASG